MTKYKFELEKFAFDIRKFHQKYVCKATGISQPMLSKFIRGKSSLRLDQFLNICEFIKEKPQKYIKELNV